MARSVIGHGLQKTTYGFLIEWFDASVLRNQLLFFWSKHLSERSRTPPRQNKRRIYATLFKRRHIAKVERTRSQFVVFLSPPTYPKKHTKLGLT